MLWYPYSQMKTMKTPYEIKHAKGVYLYTKEKKLIDATSSWWSTIHGYNNEELNNALIEQINNFSHVMLGGLTHEPAQLLASKLASYLPKDLDYCFFSDSGSVAVEVSLKMALQYYLNQNNNQRKIVLTLNKSYHGDTFKAMEVGDDDDYHFLIDDNNPCVHHIDTNIRSLEKAFEIYGKNLNCFLVEPLLQGAGGMQMYDVEFLKRARQLCDEHDVLLIFDEVATGFGRTGNRFVADLVCPDIIILGKALTAGYLGHAVTVANHKVFDAFYSDDPKHALMHGPTFMANALACSIALKSIEIFERENYLEKIKNIEKILRRETNKFNHPKIKEIRIMGACICVEVKDEKTIVGFQEYAYEKGVYFRPFIKYIYAMVPYIIEKNELILITNTIKEWFI